MADIYVQACELVYFPCYCGVLLCCVVLLQYFSVLLLNYSCNFLLVLVCEERKGLLLFTKVPNFIECNPQPSWKLVVGRLKLDGASTQGLLLASLRLLGNDEA